MERIYQDFSFDVPEAEGRLLVRLCGFVDLDDPDDSPIVVFARLDNPPEWHRFFLELGAAFWEKWSDADIEDEHDNDSFRLLDYYDSILPRSIRRAYAFQSSPTAATRIVLELDGAYSVRLACIGDVPDNPTCISLTPNPKAS